ncbi:MAG: ExeM/NucH family extracellular endonuclease, partial [Anaerolineae bacterium]|nr:ExeM/NucH family extracellular endonuclease [Anaerolineae bacterium]
MLQDIVPSKQTLVALAVLACLLMALVLPASLIAAPVEAPLAAPLANDLRLSQVYGGGGNTGATYTNDFIEIFNAGAGSINLNGYSVQYASATGATWQVTNLGGSIGPGQYYLIQEAQGSGGTTPLPTPDAIGTIPMSGTNGKVALVNTTNAQSGACPAGAQIIDFVGFGSANCYEGTGATPVLSNTTAAIRNGAGCIDTDDNAADFTTGAPTPRNTASPTNSCGVDVPPTVIDTTPADGEANVPTDTVVDVTFSEPVVISGTISIDCTSSGLQNVTPTGGPTTFDLPHSDFQLGETCTVSIDADQVTDQDGDPNNMAQDYTWSFDITNGCFGGGTTPIHDIQGSGLVSPIVGQQVVVEALVNADYQSVSSIRGFFMEEPDGEQDANPATSEGIFIYDNNFGVDVAVGDYVRVSGTVGEFQEQTQLTSITSVTLCENDPVSATPVSVTLPFSETVYPERFEGMSVTLPQTLTVSENYNLGRGGILTLSNGRLQQPTNVVDPGAPANALQDANNLNQITLDDGNLAQNPDPIVYPPPELTALNTVRSGDEVSEILGVMTQGTPGWSSAGILYRVYPYEMPTFTAANPRPVAPDPVRAGGSLRVSSFNVLNYFLTLAENGPICGPTQDEDCRGAYNSSEFTRQRDKLLQALYILDADVLGLMELENTPGVEPLADLVDGLNGLTAPGTYAFIDTGTMVPGDVIKVGIIYKPAVVQPVGGFAILNSLVDPAFDTSLNRPAVAQTFDEIANHGRFTVVVNHLKSKGCAGATGLNADQGDGQSCWNLTRTEAVEAELNWISGDPTNSGDPDFIILGDLNSYAKEDPIAALEAAGYTNLESAFVGPDAYSYVYFAQAGSLDHSMASPSMAPQVNNATTWHINADEPSVLDYNEDFKSANQLIILYNADEYRTSDHDPLLIGLNLESSEADLFVSKIANPDPVMIGETLYYTITTQNVSTPTVATDVVITDVLPAGVSFNGAAAYTGTCNESGGTVVCDMGDIAPEVIESVLISVTVDSAQCPGVLSNTVEVASNVYDPNPQNNSFTLETDVECVPPNIEVDPASLDSTQLPDTQVVQTLTISNTGGSLLDWTIDEEPVAGPPEAVQTVTRIDSQAMLQAELSGEENTAPTASGPRDLAAAARAQRMLLTTGLLLVPDSTNDRVMAFDPTTGNLVDADFIPADPDNLSTPKSAILSAGGNSILVSDQLEDVVQEYALDGSYMGIFAPAGGLNNAILDNITGIDLRPNG